MRNVIQFEGGKGRPGMEYSLRENRKEVALLQAYWPIVGKSKSHPLKQQLVEKYLSGRLHKSLSTVITAVNKIKGDLERVALPELTIIMLQNDLERVALPELVITLFQGDHERVASPELTITLFQDPSVRKTYYYAYWEVLDKQVGGIALSHSQGKAGDSQKGTSLREAMRQWEENTGEKASDAVEVKLIGLYPPIEKLDSSLQALVNCEKLSLSTNMIEKLSHLNNLRCLKILSLGRNNIKNFTGLEVLGETLQQLWISYNFIEKMKGIGVLKKLKVLYMSNNLVKDWSEFMKLTEVTTLEELNFVGNPLEEKHSAEGTWRSEVERKLTWLKKLDGLPIIRDVDEELILEQQQQQQQSRKDSLADPSPAS
ncbi:dynein axonemal light chain 1 [Cherax quadricarinatus]|uniref:dynein axonemal light chain 1 n=1 Tax=Cherax quadricarinatus TaxID=27406 RepID=UPI00387E87FB